MDRPDKSKLLSEILEKAQKCPEAADNGITAERVLLAAIEISEGFLDAEEKNSELEGVFLFFSTREGFDKVHAKELLRSYIHDNPRTRIHDDIYIKGKLLEAEAKAMRDNEPEVSAISVLSCIIADPTDAVRNCFGDQLSDPNVTDEIPPVQERTEANKRKKEEKQEDELRAFLSFLRSRKDSYDEDTGEEDEDDGSAEAEEYMEHGMPKENLSLLVDEVKQTRDALLERIYGQDNAVSVFTNGYFQGELNSFIDRNRRRPRATFLFAGPPGVGKTFLAETAAEVLGLPFRRFDMSEYSDREAVVQLCGSDKVYRDSQPGVLSGFVSENPKCILLFDEIEKAHINAIHIFLQILDAGRLMDAKTRKEVSFCDTICIFTTNAGKKLYEDSETEDLSGLSRKVILKALEKDINPETNAPYFPAAMCSRFASGNVVMFNHMSAHHLRNIAKGTISSQISNLETESGIKTEIDNDVYTAILLAEGGAADARMIRGRAMSFYNEELFELLRLINSEKTALNIEALEKIHFTVQLPEQNEEIRRLFEPSETVTALVFAPQEEITWCENNQACCRILGTQTIDNSKKQIQNDDVQFVMLALSEQQAAETERVLNIEDIDSEARDFFWYIRENYPDMPVYLLVKADDRISEEEQLSFKKSGVRDFIDIYGESETYASKLSEICEILHQQRNIVNLARANKLISFETSQRITEDGKTAEICLFDFELITAVDAEDSKSVLSSMSTPDICFDEVIGAEEAKKELKYFVEYLRNPKKYMGTGVNAPKGVLLYGPPGTGKTMLAKAMASEAGVTFLTAEGNQFLKKYVGEGPEAVHELFRAARKYAPSILFVDEIDAIAKPRTGAENTESREEILTAFLTEMDGFRTDMTKPVFVLAATNFDVNPGSSRSLDAALLRRFDRTICVDLPNKEERIRYIKQQLSKKPIFRVSKQVIENIAIRSTGMSLASLSSVIELSLRMAIREGGLKVTDAVFEEAFETFNSGEEKKWNPAELERIARHESGHAFLSWKSGDTPSYLTIVARANHGGYMQHGDNESKNVRTKEELLARIRTALGGRAAEIVCYGETGGLSTGAAGDLSKATYLAKQMVCIYGMDEHFGLATVDPQTDSSEIRKAVNRILTEEMKKAVQEITENRPKLDALVAKLMKSNRLTETEIEQILSEPLRAEQ